jgi:hypothetical protein
MRMNGSNENRVALARPRQIIRETPSACQETTILQPRYRCAYTRLRHASPFFLAAVITLSEGNTAT